MNMLSAMMPLRLRRPRNLNQPRPAEPRGQNYWAVMCDIDFFRAYNDIYGKSAGNEVLRQVSSALQLSFRRDDQAFSRKGEGFVMVVPGESIEQATACAERHRLAVEHLQIPHQGSPFGVVTVSIGLATIVAGGRGATEEALEKADAALLRAKRLGRNQVAAAGLALA